MTSGTIKLEDGTEKDIKKIITDRLLNYIKDDSDLRKPLLLLKDHPELEKLNSDRNQFIAERRKEAKAIADQCAGYLEEYVIIKGLFTKEQLEGKMVTFDNREHKLLMVDGEPYAITKFDPDLQAIADKIDKIVDKEETADEKSHHDFWDKIEGYLKSKGLIGDPVPDLEIKDDEVMYIIGQCRHEE